MVIATPTNATAPSIVACCGSSGIVTSASMHAALAMAPATTQPRNVQLRSTSGIHNSLPGTARRPTAMIPPIVASGIPLRLAMNGKAIVRKPRKKPSGAPASE